MNNLNANLIARNNLDDIAIYYHGSSNAVVNQLVDGDMDVNQVFHVTDDPIVAARYAGNSGSVMAIATRNVAGVRSQITMCRDASVNGANQWVMNADDANDMIDDADLVVAVPVWAVYQVMAA